jgi:hypothetical protein
VKVNDLYNPHSFGREVVVTGGPFAGAIGFIRSWEMKRETITIGSFPDYTLGGDLLYIVEISTNSVGRLRIEIRNLEFLPTDPLPSYLELFI